MDVLSFGIGLWVGVGIVCCCSSLPNYLARRKAKKRIKAVEERIKFKEEVGDMVRRVAWDEARQLKRDLTSYIDTKLAEKDKQEESGEEGQV